MGHAHPSEYRLVPDCRISVGGKRLSLDDASALTRAQVDLDVDLFGQCILTFTDPAMRLIDGALFQSGVAVRVELGFRGKLKQVFEGEVVGLEPQFRRDLPPSLRVVCLEKLHRLALSQATRAINGADDRQIAARIGREHGFKAQAPAGTREHLLQSNVSDAVFLRRLARRHGNHLRIEGKTLVIAAPPKGAQAVITPGDGIKKVKLQIDSRTQVSEVSVHGWDPKAKRELVASAKGVGATGEGARKHGGGARLALAGRDPLPPDVATAESMARGRMRTLAEGFVKVQVEMIGSPDAVPGYQFTLDRFGAQVDGSYRVEHARHEFSRHGYMLWLRTARVAKKAPKPPA